MSSDSVSFPAKPAEPKGRRQSGQPPKHAGRNAPGGDDRRRRRSPGAASQRRQGFADGLDHAFCTNYRHRLPREFPPHDRAGLATVQPSEVARRSDAVLLCDRRHLGSCVWPDGEPVVSPLGNQTGE
ncbi:MAG TPA: hypothetical protein VFL82_01440 [Thermomicrobiales bacterium]|nr:hypothetical protein [Thermomicrobiales bacterium]